MVKFSYWQVTPKQYELLRVLAETGSVEQAVKAVGENKYKLGLMLAVPEGKSLNTFQKAYNHVMDGLSKDFDYSKVKNLSTLKTIVEDMSGVLQEETKWDDEGNQIGPSIDEKAKAANVILKAIGEMNKMQDGNLAVKKTEHNERKVELKGTIDLSKPPEEDTEELEDTEYEELTDG